MDLALVFAVAVIALVGWMTLAPASLGGGSRYGSVVGTSMEPNLRAGDLIVVRPGTYRPGDVVAYPLDGQLIVHRVVELAGTRLVLRGDANPAVDRLRPTPSEVLGKVRVRVPHVGAAFAFLHRHLLALILAGVVSIAYARLCASARSAGLARSTPRS